MDHSFIEETNQIDRYVRGTMPPAEREAFEEHFLDCPDCLAQLEIAKSLRESVRIAAADMAASPALSRVADQPRRFWSWKWTGVGAIAGLAAAAIIIIVQYRQLDHTRRELNRTHLAYAREREGLLQGAEPLVYTMGLNRGTAAAPESVVIPRSPRWVVFSIQIDASQFQQYRAVLRNEAGQTVWQKDGLRPSSPDAIAIPVPSMVLTSGVYKLSLDGGDAPGRYAPMAAFTFKAEGQR